MLLLSPPSWARERWGLEPIDDGLRPVGCQPNPLVDAAMREGVTEGYFSAGAITICSVTFYQSLPEPRLMADFTKEWIEHLKTQISGRMSVVADKMDPQAYDELVTDLAWFTFRFARDPDTKMRKVFR